MRHPAGSWAGPGLAPWTRRKLVGRRLSPAGAIICDQQATATNMAIAAGCHCACRRTEGPVASPRVAHAKQAFDGRKHGAISQPTRCKFWIVMPATSSRKTAAAYTTSARSRKICIDCAPWKIQHFRYRPQPRGSVIVRVFHGTPKRWPKRRNDAARWPPGRYRCQSTVPQGCGKTFGIVRKCSICGSYSADGLQGVESVADCAGLAGNHTRHVAESIS